MVRLLSTFASPNLNFLGSFQANEKFYPKMLGYLLRYILKQHQLSKYKEIIVFTDRIPIQRKKKAVEKAIKETLAKMLPESARYRIYHHDSKSNFQRTAIS